jgi:hypothetical protein
MVREGDDMRPVARTRTFEDSGPASQLRFIEHSDLLDNGA